MLENKGQVAYLGSEVAVGNLFVHATCSEFDLHDLMNRAFTTTEIFGIMPDTGWCICEETNTFSHLRASLLKHD